MANSNPTNGHEGALSLLQIGLVPTPCAPLTKRCIRTGWPGLRLNADDVKASQNVAVVLGFDRHLDVDLDAPVSRALALHFLPRTCCRWGRSKDDPGHYTYQLHEDDDGGPELPRRQTYTDRQGSMLVEVRGLGHSSLAPGSIHPDTRQLVVWVEYGQPTPINWNELEQAVRQLAACCLLATVWPAPGSHIRDEFATALVAAMRGRGLGDALIIRLVERAAEYAQDEQWAERARPKLRHLDTLGSQGRQRHLTGYRTAGRLIDYHGLGSALDDRLGTTPPTQTTQPTSVVGVNMPGLGLGPAQTPPEDQDGLPGPAGGHSGHSGRPTPRPYRGTTREIPPYPVHRLPEVLRELCMQGALAIGVDPVAIALPALVLAAGTIGNTRACVIKEGWLEPPCLWGVVIAPSGYKKSPAIDLGTMYLRRLEARAEADHHLEVERVDDLITLWRAAPRATRGDMPRRPDRVRVHLISDCTIEEVFHLMTQNPRGLTLIRDELDTWYSSFIRQSSGGVSSVSSWNELYNSKPISIRRRDPDKPPVASEASLLSVTGTIQLRTLAKTMTPEYIASGFGARHLLAMPAARPHTWTDAVVPREVLANWNAALLKLRGLTGIGNDDGIPHPVPMTSEAHRLWVTWYNTNAAAIYELAEPDLRSAYSKLEGAVARIALVIHCLECVSNVAQQVCLAPVTDRAMFAAIELVRWHALVADQVYPLLRGKVDDDDPCNKLVEWLEQHGRRATVREVMRSLRPRPANRCEAEALLHELVARGLGRWEGDPELDAGGRPPAVFHLALVEPEVDADD